MYERYIDDFFNQKYLDFQICFGKLTLLPKLIYNQLQDNSCLLSFYWNGPDIQPYYVARYRILHQISDKISGLFLKIKYSNEIYVFSIG